MTFNILRNSVIEVGRCPLLPAGNYRILDFRPNDDALYVIPMGRTSADTKPKVVGLSNFLSLVESGLVTNVVYKAPRELLLSDNELSSKNVEVRDRKYSQIKALVEDPTFLQAFCVPRSRVVIEHAEVQGVSALEIYRALRRYWEFGQVPNALLNFTSAYGGRGKIKSYSGKQRGRPVNNGIFSLRQKRSINVTAKDREEIHEAMQAAMEERKKITYSGGYEKYKEMFAERELASAVANSRPAQIITYNQFHYWAKKLTTEAERLKSYMIESSFQKDHTGSLSSVSDRFTAPGMRYEIDSTVADVYVVCELSRQRVLGRPTIYFIVDAASRMIVGMHVSMEYASWNAARQALFNACVSKIDYCRRYGIEITDEDWPSVGVAATLIADRGEMLSENAFNHAKKVGTQLAIAPTGRGDFKSIVERRFGIANEEIHFLPGTTLGQLRERGEPDCRLEAAITLSTLTKILIEKVLEHNNYDTFDDLLNRDLIQNDIKHTPRNYWNFYVSRFQSALKHFSESHFASLLMVQGKANVTREGILLNGLRYSCRKAIDGDWATLALHSGSWQVTCWSDESWSSHIYIREPHGQELLKCDLLPASRVYAGLAEIEVTYISEWKKAKAEEADKDHHKIQRTRSRQDLVAQELKLTAAEPLSSKRAKVVNIRSNRQEFLKSQTPHAVNSQNEHRPAKTSKPVDKSRKMRKLFESIREEDGKNV